jgi:hypothetical protein
MKVGVIWDLSVEKIDADTCEFTNAVHNSFTPELLDSLAKQGIPKEVFQAARKPISEAHNRQETPLFATSIDRHALSGTGSASPYGQSTGGTFPHPARGADLLVGGQKRPGSPPQAVRIRASVAQSPLCPSPALTSPLFSLADRESLILFRQTTSC